MVSVILFWADVIAYTYVCFSGFFNFFLMHIDFWEPDALRQFRVLTDLFIRQFYTRNCLWARHFTVYWKLNVYVLRRIFLETLYFVLIINELKCLNIILLASLSNLVIIIVFDYYDLAKANISMILGIILIIYWQKM